MYGRVRSFQEVNEYNASGGYEVRMPWHVEQDRELNPAETLRAAIRWGTNARSLHHHCAVTVPALYYHCTAITARKSTSPPPASGKKKKKKK